MNIHQTLRAAGSIGFGAALGMGLLSSVNAWNPMNPGEVSEDAGGTLVMHYNPTNAPAGIRERDVKRAIEKWNQANAGISVAYGGQVAEPLSKWLEYSDGLNVIGWSAPGVTASLGSAMFSFDECDVQLGSEPYDWERYKLDNVLTHEVGHCLGLGHSNNDRAIMWWVANGVTELNRDDVTGLRALYPKAGTWNRTWAGGVAR